MSQIDTIEILREELDELHERFAVLTDRVSSLERDRDMLLAAVETQAEVNEQSAACQERLGRLIEEMSAKADARHRQGQGHA
ncbi:MAG: hypothetical protein NVSMB9_27390 [Isosphaeraceae bacterium]